MKLIVNKFSLLLLLILAAANTSTAQDSSARELLLNIAYYLPADNIPYLKISAKEKVERKFIPQKNITGAVYFGEATAANLLSKIKTNEKGESIVYIPAALKSIWDSATSFKFIAETEAGKIFPATTSEIDITKARIELDTSTTDEVKNITVKVTELKNGEWLPAKNAELKIAVKRSIGNLPVADEETYTTDSTGTVTAEFKRDSLSGDAKGNLILIARTEDNETYGNISAEKSVNWGKVPKIENNFNHRSLWAPRWRTPVWLLGIAYVIIGGVWGTLIYLIFQIIKIRKLGKAI
jgi:hypothetical protein